MKTSVFNSFKGDRLIWAIIILLATISFLPVYSAASNLAYIGGSGNTFGYLVKHFVHIVLGVALMFMVHKVPYKYFKGISIVMYPVVVVLLLVTLFQGTTIDGANASRWIRIPVVGSFQTSTLAGLVLMINVARYVSRIKDQEVTFKKSFLQLWLPVFLVLILILPANFSTTAILFSMVVLLAFIGGYPFKYIMVILGAGFLVLTLFVLTAKAFPDAMPNRVDTWISRVENFSNGEDTEADYQIEKAKIAIATGGIQGRGPGKSIQKNFLPQSSSDFIFAIIIEEYGLIGGLGLLLLYGYLLFRIVIISQKAKTVFGKLLVLAVGVPIVFQALINMAVAVELFPVTGQTLPLISSGGTSIWMTCIAAGIIVSVSIKKEEKEVVQVDDKHPLDILSETL